MFSRKTKHIVQIEFDNVPGIQVWKKELPIPKEGERVFFDIWRKGKVLSITHRLEDKVYNTRIRVGGDF